MRWVHFIFFSLFFTTVAAAQDWSQKLSDAVEAGTLAEQVEPLATELKLSLQSKEVTDARLIELAAWYRYAAFFSRVEITEELDKKCLMWLIAQPNLSRTVCLAIGPTDQPDKVLHVLRALYRTDRETMEKWPDLVAALVVVWDAPATQATDDDDARGDWAVWLYQYFTRANSRLRFNLKDMPFQLQTYVVDLAVSKEEIAWVWNRYGKRGDVGGIYFEVPYDTAAFYQGADKKIGAVAYTLDNLQRLGGICSDQAYFATQVGRTLGVPSLTITGQGGAGEVAHAWVGYLDRRGKTLVWNLRSGRYDHQLYWTGQVADPQTRNTISESETALLAELQNTTPTQRMRALAMVRSVDLLEPEKQVDLLLSAINLSAGDRQAWHKLGELGAAGKLTPDQANQIASVVESFASKQYADLAYQVYLKMISGKSNIEQIQLLDKLVGVFKQRPDLIAAIRVEQGKMFRGLKQTDRAINAWGDVLTNHLYAGPAVMEAMQLTDDLLREEKQGKRLLAIYEHVFARVPRPTPSPFSAYTPYCQIGVKYAYLLDDAGDRAGAQQVRQKVAIFDKSVQITGP